MMHFIRSMLRWSSFFLAFICSHSLWAQNIRIVKPAEIQDFAKSFSCSNPVLNWQFQNLISLYDENAKAASRRNASQVQNFVFSDGTSEGWLYRGVTNRQFNEAQILRVIFNDPTSVSESRWMTEGLFGNSAGNNIVAARDNFQALSRSEQESKFKQSFLSVSSRIQALIDQPNTYTNAFLDHVRVGTPLNGTPQAIQFLTPHKQFAEFYGEFVLHVREVVRRGIDVERYNFHIPELRYTIGSIYAHDRDEYMVPSHIPAWDIQVVKVRNGSGWHQLNYGAPLYYYTKLFKDYNPCETFAVRVDKLPQGVAASDDAQRVPVGIILKCTTKEKCDSKWDGALGEAEQRLMTVVAQVKVDGKSLYFLPYKAYQAMNPEIIRSESLSNLVSLYSFIPDNLKADTSLWEHVFFAGFEADYQSANALIELNPTLRAPPVLAKIKSALVKKLVAKSFALNQEEIAGLLRLANRFELLKLPELQNIVLRLLVGAGPRATVVSVLNSLSETSPSARALARIVFQKMATMKDLTPAEEIILAVKQRPPGTPVVRSAAAKLAEAVDADGSFAPLIWNELASDPEARMQIFSGMSDEIVRSPGKYLKFDGFGVWARLAPALTKSDANEKANLMGLFIDLGFSLKRKGPRELAQEVGAIGLPEGREVDTIRSLWSYARAWDKPDFNAYQFYSSEIRNITFAANAEQISKSNGTPNEKESRIIDLKKSYVQFFAESVSPPEPILGLSSLYMISGFTENYDLMRIAKGPWIDVGLKGSPVAISTAFSNGILKTSFSVFYLSILKRQIDNEKDATKKSDLVKHLGEVLQGFKDYALNDLERDLVADDRGKLLLERFKWNANDNSVGLVLFLATMTSDSSKSAALNSLAKRVQIRFQEMPATIPAIFNRNAEATTFWSQFITAN